MNRLFLCWHLGLGDAILCSGLVRGLLERHPHYDGIDLPALPHNADSVRHLFKDLGGMVSVKPCDASQLPGMADALESYGQAVMRLGVYGKDLLNGPKHFDQDFYAQALVPYHYRWDKFRCDGNAQGMLRVLQASPPTPYVLVHDDASRGYNINLPGANVFRVSRLGDNLFAWHMAIQSAAEIHCIDSSVLCWIDSDRSMPRENLYWHRGARAQKDPNAHPKLHKEWKIID